jgi:hypothetical protein
MPTTITLLVSLLAVVVALSPLATRLAVPSSIVLMKDCIMSAKR